LMNKRRLLRQCFPNIYYQQHAIMKPAFEFRWALQEKCMFELSALMMKIQIPVPLYIDNIFSVQSEMPLDDEQYWYDRELAATMIRDFVRMKHPPPHQQLSLQHLCAGVSGQKEEPAIEQVVVDNKVVFTRVLRQQRQFIKQEEELIYTRANSNFPPSHFRPTNTQQLISMSATELQGAIISTQRLRQFAMHSESRRLLNERIDLYLPDAYRRFASQLDAPPSNNQWAFTMSTNKWTYDGNFKELAVNEKVPLTWNLFNTSKSLVGTQGKSLKPFHTIAKSACERYTFDQNVNDQRVQSFIEEQRVNEDSSKRYVKICLDYMKACNENMKNAEMHPSGQISVSRRTQSTISASSANMLVLDDEGNEEEDENRMIIRTQMYHARNQQGTLVR
jgi:hypothetical protein